MSDLLPLLSDLTNVNGVSGFEAPVAWIVKSQLSDICEISGDNLGSVICRLKSSGPGPKVALAGHLDEIGFMVNIVTKEGFVKFLNLGGWWDQVLLAQRVVIETHKGPVMGVIGSKPPHILPAEKRNEIVKARDMFVDVGATSKEEADALGIRPGDAITPVSEFTEMSVAGWLLAKAWDDRVGVALFVHALQRLNGESVPNELYGLGTVQEEVGLRGAATSAFAVQPDVCIVLETAIAGDVPGIAEDESAVKLGGGPTIYLLDGSLIAQLRLRDLLIEVCEQNEIPYQFSLLPGGGTDGGRVHLTSRGVPSIVLAVPTRHIHAHAGIIDIKDYEQTLDLLCKVIQRLDAQTVAGLTEQ